MTLLDRVDRAVCWVKNLFPTLVWRGVVLRVKKDGIPRKDDTIIIRGLTLMVDDQEPVVEATDEHLRVRFHV